MPWRRPASSGISSPSRRVLLYVYFGGAVRLPYITSDCLRVFVLDTRLPVISLPQHGRPAQGLGAPDVRVGTAIVAAALEDSVSTVFRQCLDSVLVVVS